MHCFLPVFTMSYICTWILSLSRLFYAYFAHGPNTSTPAQGDYTRGAWLTQEGCTVTEKKEVTTCRGERLLACPVEGMVSKASERGNTVVELQRSRFRWDSVGASFGPGLVAKINLVHLWQCSFVVVRSRQFSSVVKGPSREYVQFVKIFKTVTF